MGETKIQWTDRTWNPVRGCSRVSEGCRNCYAERQAARFSDPGMYAHGFVERTKNGPRWTGKVELVQEKIHEPLRWKKPSRVFVNSMSDLFHESLSDEAIGRVFGVMGMAERHTFQVLTKRASRMAKMLANTDWWHRVGRACEDYAERVEGQSAGAMMGFDAWWQGCYEQRAFPNVWLGVSCEDQGTADERIPMLLKTPAALRFVSAEPMLGPVRLRAFMWPVHGSWKLPHRSEREAEAAGAIVEWNRQGLVLAHSRFVNWVIVGGESGPGARPCDIDWIRAVVTDCSRAEVPCFVKQLGSNPWANLPADVARRWPCIAPHYAADMGDDPKGGNPAEWPEDLRVRQFPLKKE